MSTRTAPPNAVAGLAPRELDAELKWVREYACRFASRHGALDGEDLAQTALVRIWENLATYRPLEGKPFRAWCCGVVNHVVLDSVRARYADTKRAHGLDAIVAIGTPRCTPETDLRADRAEENRLAVISTLDDDDREIVFALVRQEGGELTRAQAAASVGLTVPQLKAARTRVARRITKAMSALDLTLGDLLENGAANGTEGDAFDFDHPTEIADAIYDGSYTDE